MGQVLETDLEEEQLLDPQATSWNERRNHSPGAKWIFFFSFHKVANAAEKADIFMEQTGLFVFTQNAQIEWNFKPNNV